jgi:hypothetical protein
LCIGCVPETPFIIKSELTQVMDTLTEEDKGRIVFMPEENSMKRSKVLVRPSIQDDKDKIPLENILKKSKSTLEKTRLFEGVLITFSEQLSIDEQTRLRKLLASTNARITEKLTSNVSHFIVNAMYGPSERERDVLRHGTWSSMPVVVVQDWIYDSINAKITLSHDAYIYKMPTSSVRLKKTVNCDAQSIFNDVIQAVELKAPVNNLFTSPSFTSSSNSKSPSFRSKPRRSATMQPGRHLPLQPTRISSSEYGRRYLEKSRSSTQYKPIFRRCIFLIFGFLENKVSM